MAKFIDLGDGRYLNLDHVCYITFDTEYVDKTPTEVCHISTAGCTIYLHDSVVVETLKRELRAAK